MEQIGGSSSSTSTKKKENAPHCDLIDVVFSWPLKDILNEQFYRHKVEKIPETFSSVKHYLSSFVYPLIEETHADMNSRTKILSQAPTCEIMYGRKEKRYTYVPEKWDVIALSSVRPMCIGDLNRPLRRYLPAIVVRGGDEDNNNMIQILTSKPIAVKQHEDKKREAVFAIFLTNITTNIRIWRALEGEKNSNIINQVLNADSKVGTRCGTCFFQEMHVLRQDLHADLQSLELNKSQTNAVLSSIEMSQCNHKSSVRLIWVVEVASRLLNLVKESISMDLYRLGDIVLFGNEGRMKIDDHDYLNVIHLEYRVKRLVECFSPLTGWRHQLDSVISLLEDPGGHYKLYLTNAKNRREEEKNDGTNKKTRVGEKKNETMVKKEGIIHSIGSGGKDDQTSDEVLTFWEFIRKQFGRILKELKYHVLTIFVSTPTYHMRNLCTHLPTSFISVGIVEKINRALNLLKSLRSLSKNGTFCQEALKNIFISAAECLQLLRCIREELFVPNFCAKSMIRTFCLQNACLILCTASSSAILREVKPFQLLVIDEAAQLKECESAIPLQLPCVQHAILIGDECQLPATVRSKISKKAGLGRSLFERLVSLGQRKHLLNIQYRMHPSISLFPNTEFYAKQISDAPNVKDRSYKKHFLQGSMYGSYSFINVAYGKDELDCGYSRKNMVEVAVISEIVAKLYEASVHSGQMVTVGVVSPYNAQVSALQQKLGDKYGTYSNFSVSVRSVDGFQGGEKDVVLISTVRSNANGSVGFLSNHQRTNVALTRARYCLWIIGHGPTLVNNDSIWKKLVRDAQNRGCYFHADNDKALVKPIIDSMAELLQLNDLLNTNSILFRDARWKSQKEIVLLLIKLSSGWRDPLQRQRNISLVHETSSQLLEQYKLDGALNLLWTVDIMLECSHLIQVLKFWDILQSSKIPKLTKHLDNIFGCYKVDKIYRCKHKCLEGSSETQISQNRFQVLEEHDSPSISPNSRDAWKSIPESLSQPVRHCQQDEGLASKSDLDIAIGHRQNNVSHVMDPIIDEHQQKPSGLIDEDGFTIVQSKSQKKRLKNISSDEKMSKGHLQRSSSGSTKQDRSKLETTY
ncbi:hypothetical protein AQUCO_00200938v1 [Aquilegia coerulea]|uniref:DNA2/NAM7 helicase-like C-terminal domain-containing protein n=1 Tax=Aquilegia coerulea TaxID=218851 RepID=A0A2G5F5G2_AQUCA|nr:hypothetical protein AQUCO_00200938v1 [Aquilegia coerulea]